MAHHKDPPQWMGLPVGDLCSGHAMVLHIPASATSSMFLSGVNFDPYSDEFTPNLHRKVKMHWVGPFSSNYLEPVAMGYTMRISIVFWLLISDALFTSAKRCVLGLVAKPVLLLADFKVGHCSHKSSSLYDLHLTSVQSSSSASHKRKKIYLAKRSSRAFNEKLQIKLCYTRRRFQFCSRGSIDETTLTPTRSITVKDITQRFGASLSAIVVTFFTRSHDCSMRRWDRTEEPFFLELKSLHFFIRPCLSHVHLLRSCSTRKLSDFGLVRDCPKGVMGTFGYAVPQYVSTDRDARNSRESGIDK
ncbi:hypothetical protein DY000_02055818 [Brassica cretica]|uniref:Protein kinase domain-containing protein n=1 Tax=Brassica cretica TaxID=69181 RepID=A0ABQ7AFT5_BRACR|nr:hypothetical protein DY000_02055818 [Brassica cretica]